MTMQERRERIMAEFTCPLMAKYRIIWRAKNESPTSMIDDLRWELRRAMHGKATAGSFPHEPKESVQNVIAGVLARYEELFFMLRDSGRFVAWDEINREMTPLHEEIRAGNF